jgi:hypothetical protein
MMISTLILAASVAGQACYVNQRAVTRTYAPAYSQGYAPTYYAGKARVETTIVATELYEPRIYGVLAGAGIRAETRRKQDQASVAGLTARVDKLSASIDRLGTLFSQVVVTLPTAPVAPTPVAPGKPTPEVPGKPTPDSGGSAPPPLPKTNPDDGSVPPPPVPPEAASVLRSRCLSCHSAESAPTLGKGFALFDGDGAVRTDVPSNKLLDLAFRVSTGNMPRKALPLPPDEQAAIKAWVLSDPRVGAFLGATPTAK